MLRFAPNVRLISFRMLQKHSLSLGCKYLSTSKTINNQIDNINSTSASQTTMPKFPDPIKPIMTPAGPESADENEGLIEGQKSRSPVGEVEPRNYFDTMDIYNELIKLGYNEAQSDTILRLIKENVTVQLSKLEEKTLNKNELENELYLFEAAQSELKLETKTSRELDVKSLFNEKSNLESLLDYESDELNKLLIVSKNDSQVVMNDQISENTLLQKKIKRMVQDLNSRISTEINSDIKSEIEGLRWHTTRNGIMAVLVLVFFVMGGVSISKRLNRDDQPTEVILRTIQPEEHNHEGADQDEPSTEEVAAVVKK